MKDDRGTIKLPKELLERLKSIRKSHQAIPGVIEELLDEHNKESITLKPDTIKRLRENEKYPKEPLEDIINGIIDDLYIKIENIKRGK